MTNVHSKTMQGIISAALFSGAFLFSATTVQADVKIVSKVTTSGSLNSFGNRGGSVSSTPASQTFKTYIKGKKARREAADGSVVIYDREADKIYRLDPKAKTGTYTSFAAAVNEPRNQNNNFSREESRVTVRDSGKTANVNGIAARSYAVTGGQTRTVNLRSRMRGNAPSNMPASLSFGSNVTGNVSLINANAILPRQLSGASFDRSMTLPIVEQILPANSALMRPLLSGIARYQAAPVAAQISVARVLPQMPNNSDGSAPQAPPAQPPATINFEIQSITKDLTLEDKLFAVPTDFTLTEAPDPTARRIFAPNNNNNGNNNGRWNRNNTNGQDNSRWQRRNWNRN